MQVCVIQPALDVDSETFIRAHAEGLPGVCGVIYRQGGLVSTAGAPVLSQGVVHRSLRWSWRRLRRQSWQWEVDQAYAQALRRYRADVVLAEYGTTANSARGGCQLAGVPLVVHFHGYDASRKDILERLAEDYRAMLQQAAAVVVVSRAMQRRVISLGCSEEKIFYNPCGFDEAKFQGAAPQDNGPCFVTVGRMVEKKGPYLTLAAFRQVLDAVPEARLRMIGDGPLMGVCRDLTLGLDMQHAVTFLGSQPHEVVQHEMRNARAFVQHSLTAANGDSEGTPVAVLEAGGMGLPVISTRHAGIPDVVVQEQTGLLVEERDVAGMARQMIRLAKDPELAGQVGRAASVHVRTRYTMQHSISRLGRVLEAVAKGADLAPVKAEIEKEFAAPSVEPGVIASSSGGNHKGASFA